MVSNGKELLGELYGRDHLTYEEKEDLELTVVTEKGETISAEELRSKIFRIVERDEPSGYVVRNMETTGEGTTLCYLQVSFPLARWPAWARGRPLLRRHRALRSDGAGRTLPAMMEPEILAEGLRSFLRPLR